MLRIAFLSFSLLLLAMTAHAQMSENKVQIIGAMKDVMWNGRLAGSIRLDTIANKKNLYGLGPVSYLSGELLIIDGRAYRSSVMTDSTMTVDETYQTEAPFFVYANVNEWEIQDLPEGIRTIHQLESWLDTNSKQFTGPFAFRLAAVADSAIIHIVNLPKGAKVRSPEEAHNGQKNYLLANKEVEIIGFFSRQHKSVFTHHDSFVHMHLITSDRTKMGHLDTIRFKEKSVKLYLPKQ
jgi:acetolactate decarboxylase